MTHSADRKSLCDARTNLQLEMQTSGLSWSDTNCGHLSYVTRHELCEGDVQLTLNIFYLITLYHSRFLLQVLSNCRLAGEAVFAMSPSWSSTYFSSIAFLLLTPFVLPVSVPVEDLERGL